MWQNPCGKKKAPASTGAGSIIVNRRKKNKPNTARRASAAPANPFALPAGLLSAGDPVDGNPFSTNHLEHRVWQEATLKAEEELCRLNSEFQNIEPTGNEGFAAWMQNGGPAWTANGFAAWTISMSVGKFDIWAKRSIQIVWSENALRAYDQWLFSYAQAWIDSQREAGKLTESSLFELRSRLIGRMEWWKAEGRRYLSEQKTHAARPQGGATVQNDRASDVLRTEDRPPTIVKLTDREKTILEVIQRGSKGLAYCRELDTAGIKCRRTKSWEGCPTTYPAAYQAGSPWRHRIQDEKSKINGKAKLAGTRK
jgi:hypothetical protein